ncbi:unnamed protein product [Schistosoma curassoni]|uniref:Uncharacterized protein n=1 Tax=Schistosoma curassoni TaxID=6186 RepID=A0A183JF59_9TREM|nr:unnamed protein product [Schistosoma curassoni]
MFDRCIIYRADDHRNRRVFIFTSSWGLSSCRSGYIVVIFVNFRPSNVMNITEFICKL